MSQFGEMLRAARQKRKLSIRGAAPLLNISIAHLCDMENGMECNPTAATLNAIRREYGLSAKSLMDALDS